MNFKNYYLLPLSESHSRVFTKTGEDAFDFAEEYLCPNFIKTSVLSRNRIVTLLNSNSDRVSDLTKQSIQGLRLGALEYKNEVIFSGGRELIIIRGWGHLTGMGGLALDTLEARDIQTEFAHYIMQKLTPFLAV